MKRLIFLSVALVALLAAGCGKGNFSERTQVGKENVFRYPIVTNPTSLDPGKVEDGDTIDMIQQVYEGLVTWSEDNQPVGLLADSWTVSDDGTLYTFKIKEGVKFHNGQDLTADDFKWTYERSCEPALISSTAPNYLGEIVGVKEKISGNAKEISGIKVVDKYTLSIQIDKVRPYFLGKLTYIVNAVLPKGGVPMSEIKNAKEMIGTGPFKAEQYVPDQLIVLAANKDYHGGAPLIDKIERPVIKDAATRLNKFKAGELDLVMLERQDVTGLQGDETFKSQLKFFPRPAVWYVAMNSLHYKPFKDVRVRQAVGMAIDKNAIVNDILGGINSLADSIVPPGVLGHRDDAKGLAYNVEKAKMLLAEAGYPGGKGMPTLELRFREQRPDIRIVSEAVASQLAKNLGMKVSLRTMEWRAFLEARNRFEHDFVHMRWAADYLDPENFLSFMLGSYPYGPENRLGYSNPRFDALCKEADSTMDPVKRLQLYAEAEDIALQEAAWVPIYFQRDAELISPRVSGLRESLFGHLPHTTVKLSN